MSQMSLITSGVAVAVRARMGACGTMLRIFPTEVIAPLADAVRLVHADKVHLHVCKLL